jgi:uncharacterized protein (TIRG00374 family)
VSRRVRAYLPLAVTLVLLILVFRQVGAAELGRVVRQAHPGYLALAFVIGTATIFTSASKVRILLRAQGHHVPYSHLLRLGFVGIFFNNFLPTNVGGDVIRSYEIGRRIEDQATAVAAVFVERLTGFLVLLGIAAVSCLTHLAPVENGRLTAALSAAIAGLCVVVWIALDPRLSKRIEARLPGQTLQRYSIKFRKFQSALHRYRGQRQALAQNVAWSFLFYVMAILYVHAAVRAFHRPVPLLDLAFIVPITMVVAMLPLTFNGIGLQEWSYVLLFPRIGVPASAALLAMLAIRAITVVSAAIGGLLYLQMRSRRREEVAAAGA